MTRRPGGLRATPAPVPRRPYRDSVVVHAALALVVIAIALATGGTLVRAIVVALGYFVLATAWSWWRFRVRLRAEGR